MRTPLPRRLGLLPLIALVLLAACRTAIQPVPEASLPVETEGRVGDLRVRFEGYALREDAGDGPALLVVLRFTNTGDNGYALSPEAQLRVLDAGESDYRPREQEDRTRSAGMTIPPGAQIRAEAGFDLPTDAGPYLLEFAQVAGREAVAWRLDEQSGGTLLPQEPVAEPPGLLSLDQEARVGDASLRLVGVRQADEPPVEPREGHAFVVISVELRNDGTDEYALSPLMQFRVYDQAGFQQPPAESVPLPGELQRVFDPGESARGDLAFEVPRATAPYYLVFAQPVGDESAVWRIDAP